MANTIKQKRGTTDPGASDLVVGELAINTTDGGVFTKTDGGTVVEVGSGGGGGASAIDDLTDAVTYDGGLSIGLGTNALVNDDGTDNDNVALGYNALNVITSGSHNVAVGRGTGEDQTTGARGTYIGRYAGAKITTGSDNTCLGNLAGQGLITASYNVFVGGYAGRNVRNSSNVAIGYNAISNHSYPTRCTAVGDTALVNGGTDNVAIGHQSAGGGDNDANRSTSIGKSSGYNNEGDDNVFVGYRAGNALTTGDDNVFVGSQAGEAITTGSNNIVIGYDTDASSTTVSNEITLGNASHTSLRIPGLQSGASDGQVLTYDSTNGNIALADASGGLSRAQVTAVTLIFG